MAANRIFRMVARRFMSKGINKGIGYAAKRGKDSASMTPEQREHARTMERRGRRAHKLARMARRFL